MLSIIIPSYKGAAILRKQLPGLIAYFTRKKIPNEIIIVDDGSEDNGATNKVAKENKCIYVRHKKNIGKGRAVRTGMLKAKGDFRIFTDVDIPFELDSFVEFIRYLDFKEFDVVVGDRTLPGSSYAKKIPFTRKLGSDIFSFLAGRFVAGGYFDTQCGMKGFRKKAAEDIFSVSKIDGFAFDVEILYIALKRNYDIKRLPVILRGNESSSVKIVRHGIQMLFDLFSLPINNLLGMYKKNDNRRLGDKISIDGAYQYNAFYTGHPVQRFWHWAKYIQAEKLLSVKPGELILDVGCGSGVLSYLIAKNNKHSKVIGIDGNASAINFCKSKYSLPNLKFKKCLLDELNIKEKSVDKIVFLEVIEHIYEDQAKSVMKQFHSLLKKRGRVVISTPNYASLWPAIEYVLDKFNLVPHLSRKQHIGKYTDEKLMTLGSNTGFKTIAKHSINFIAPWLNIFSNSLAQKIHELEVKSPYLLGSLLIYTFEKK